MKRLLTLLALLLTLGVGNSMAQDIDLKNLTQEQVDIIYYGAVDGMVEAQFALGSMYYFGWSIAENNQQAAYWYRKAAEQGHADAQSNLGGMYYEGKGVAQDYSTAAYWFRKAAEQGNAGAQYNLGIMYRNGYGVSQDYSTAAYWYRKAAEQGFAGAQYNLGNMYQNGEGVSQDYSTAAYWYRKAAEQGFVVAQYNLGIMYYNGYGVSQDYSTAAYWFRKAAEQGYADAQYNLGIMYHNGEGVSQDYSTAIKWYTTAANNNNSDAMLKLGDEYFKGKHVAQDYSLAKQWYIKYINSENNPLSSTKKNLGDICYDEANYSEALKWYLQYDSDIDGIYQSYILNRIADCYFEGKGVKQDYELAEKWYKKTMDTVFDDIDNMLYMFYYDDYTYKDIMEEAQKDEEYIHADTRAKEAKRLMEEQKIAAQVKAEAEAKARAEAEARAKAEAEALARDRARHPLRYFIKDSKEAWNDFKEDAAYWLFDDMHDFENYIFAEATMSLSDKLSTMVGANLDLYFNDRGRLGLHSSINFMDNGSWGFRLGPVLRLNQSWDNIEWQLYGGIGPHWAINAPLDAPYTETCHLSGDVGIRANFHKLSEDSILSYSSLSVGCQMMMGKAVPVVGVSLWPALLFSNISLSENLTTLAGETMVAFGDGFLMGASLSWTPTTLGWYGTILAPIDAAGMTITTGPVFSMLDGMFQVYGGMGLVDDEFGGDLGVRLVSDYSYSIGFQFSSTAFLTLGIGLEF